MRVLALVPTNTYRAADLLAAARCLGIDLIVGSDRRQALEAEVDHTTVTVPFDAPVRALEVVRALHRRRPLDGVVGLDDETTLPAARLAEALGLPGNPPRAVATTRSKLRLREALAGAGIDGPRFAAVHLKDIEAAAPGQAYPCVLKPTFLSASRGVIRADDAAAFVAAGRRIATLLADPELRRRGGTEADLVLVEDFLPGAEIALEAVLGDGELRLLAVFDKPDPLDGPFFEETLYVTPSRHPGPVLEHAEHTLRRAVAALGLRHGAVHAEFRLHAGRATLLELAPRPIGGLCPRVMPLALGTGLEELLLRSACGLDLPGTDSVRPAGVMMLPVPGRGLLRRVDGREEALALPGIHDVALSVHAGQELVPLPEGHRYPGFIFATGRDAAEVEDRLRAAHGCLRFDLEPPATLPAG